MGAKYQIWGQPLLLDKPRHKALAHSGGIMKNLRRAVAATAVAFGVALTALTAAPAQDQAFAAPGCSTDWGSLTKSGPSVSSGEITNLRSGRHHCFDRLVLDIQDGNGAVGYLVRYQDVVQEFGSGEVLPLRGGAKIQVIVRAPAHDPSYTPTYDPAVKAEAVDVAGYSTFRQVAFAGTFEGQSLIGVGVRARLPMRVFTLAGPGDSHTRIVIDVAHHW